MKRFCTIGNLCRPFKFSGLYLWQEKHRSKVEERIDKCVKNKLLELCDILDIPISNKSSTRKACLNKNSLKNVLGRFNLLKYKVYLQGDISAKILYFLEFPHARTESSIADKTVVTLLILIPNLSCLHMYTYEIIIVSIDHNNVL